MSRRVRKAEQVYGRHPRRRRTGMFLAPKSFSTPVLTIPQKHSGVISQLQAIHFADMIGQWQSSKLKYRDVFGILSWAVQQGV